MRSLRAIGVPEHFNHPWHKAIKNNSFTAQSIDVKFTSAPGGTGAMVNAILNNEADVAVALTEGIINAVILNQHSATPLRYCGEYVTSPLRWMITTGANRDIKDLHNLATITELLSINPQRKLNVSVSRIGSGSHLMAYVLAQQEGWSFDQLNVCVHNDFRSMRRAVIEGTADIFLWEWFMTKPYVDSTELRILGYLDTPWHCFGFLAQASWLDNPSNRRLLQETCDIVFQAAKQMLTEENSSCEELSAQFGISLEDSHSWIRMVSYAQDLVIPHPMIKQVIDTLVQTRIMKPGPLTTTTTDTTIVDDTQKSNKDKIIHGYHIEDICDIRVGRYIQPMTNEEELDWEDTVPMVSIQSLLYASSYSSSSSAPLTAPYHHHRLSPVSHTATTVRGASSLHTPTSSVDSSSASSVIGGGSSNNSTVTSLLTTVEKPYLDSSYSIALHFDPSLSSSSSVLIPSVSPVKDRPRRISQGHLPYLTRRASASASDTMVNKSNSTMTNADDLENELRAKDLYTPVLMQIPTAIGLAHELVVTRNRSDSTTSMQSTDSTNPPLSTTNTTISPNITMIDALPIDNPERHSQHYNQKSTALNAILEHLGMYGGAPVQSRSEANVSVIPFTSLPAAIDALREGGGGGTSGSGSSSGITAYGNEPRFGKEEQRTGTDRNSTRSSGGKGEKTNGNDASSQHNSWHRYGVLVDLG